MEAVNDTGSVCADMDSLRRWPGPMPPAVTTLSQEFVGSVACDMARRTLTDQEHLQLEGVELRIHVVAACHPKREGG